MGKPGYLSIRTFLKIGAIVAALALLGKYLVIESKLKRYNELSVKCESQGGELLMLRNFSMVCIKKNSTIFWE